MSTPTVCRTNRRIAWIAFIAAISCLMIYILACVVSPPAWSPDSSKIAILVSPPGDEPDRFGLFTYDIAADTHTVLDEVKADGILSAPSWSPDGKWIAYYKVEQPAPTEANVVEPNQPRDEARTPVGPAGAAETAAPLFSEEDLMLPSITSDLLEEKLNDLEDPETLDVRLIVVSPDGKERRVLAAMKWIGDEDMRTALVYSRPVWFPDSGRLLYVRGLDEAFYVGSFDLATGQTSAHVLSWIGTPALSRDGKWIASYMGEDDDTLAVARIDGSVVTYIRLGFGVERDRLWMSDGIFWSADSKRLFVVAGDTTLYAVDPATGATEPWIAADPNSKSAFHAQSSGGDKLYFITGLDSEEEDKAPQTLTLRYASLKDRTTGRLFEFSIPELGEGGGILSISPDGKTVLLRGIVEDPFGQEKSALIVFTGTTKKVIETDRWLLKPLYGDADLIFDDSLIGQWSGEDGRMSIARGAREKTYTLRWVEDGKEHRAVANLVRLKGATFLALFTDESALKKEGAADAHLLPDIFARVVQIEPTLTLQGVSYNKLAEVLRQTTDSIRPEDFGDEDMAKFERVNR